MRRIGILYATLSLDIDEAEYSVCAVEVGFTAIKGCARCSRVKLCTRYLQFLNLFAKD